MAKVELDKKVIELEAFVNEKLKSDLRNIHEARDRIYGEMSEYSQLKSTIEKLQEAGIKENVKTQMDVGCGFFMQTVIPNPTRILVCIGYGFFAEMTFAEALSFITKKIQSLEKRLDHVSQQANYVKARIKLVLEGLRELQDISPTGKQENKVI